MGNTLKKRRKPWASIVGLCLFLLMIGWMLQDILQRDGVVLGGNPNVLIMGTSVGFKPFEYHQNNKVVGFDVDLATEIAKSMGKELHIEDMAFDGLLPALDSGQVDMIAAGMSVTPERQKNALFSEPYFSSALRMITKKGSPIRNKYQLKGKKIGVQLGTTGDTFASKISGSKVIKFPTAPSVLQDLASGGVDVVILDDSPATQYIGGFEGLEILPGALSEEEYALAFKKSNLDLLSKANVVIKEMKKDGRYDELVKKYFGEKQETNK